MNEAPIYYESAGYCGYDEFDHQEDFTEGSDCLGTQSIESFQDRERKGSETSSSRSLSRGYNHKAYVLEEARKNAFHGTINTTNLEPARKKQIDGEIKKWKSWKNSLFSWLTDRKTKSTKHPMNRNAVSKPKRGHVSGPVLENEGCVATGKARKVVSPHLAGLFSSTRTAEEHEVPYMCLSQLNNPRKVNFYGPVYSVT